MRESSRPVSGLREKGAIYLGFAATGVALTVPGAVLPLLLRRWQMTDARGGVLLFCFFVASCAGSLVARGRMNWSVARGSIMVAAGGVWLSVAGPMSAYAAIALYGLGIGLSMTSISLLQSRRFPAERRMEMTRLNLVWAAGAALGPWLALRTGHIQGVLNGLSLFFVTFGAWVVWGAEERALAALEEQDLSRAASMPVAVPLLRRWGLLQIPWPLLVLMFCATGVEAATNSWLTTYAQRAGESLGMTIGAATFLWVGVLVSRGLHSVPWVARLPERAVLGASTFAMAAALGLLVARPAGGATMLAAAVLGLAAGPVYPLVVAAALRHREDTAIFVIGGVGAAALPLMTGEVSAWLHSLRAGLGVPLVAAMGMVALVAIWQRRGRETA